MKTKDSSSQHSSQDAEAWVRKKALALGFLDVAPVELEGDDPGFQVYQQWVSQGHHLPLDYLARNQLLRKNPQHLEEGLSSAFVFIHPYPRDFPSRMIAKYAWGKDYHQTLKEKLHILLKDYEHHFGPLEAQRICVDTAPILERSLAQRSGLGWIGKNGCLISRKHGSFFLIAVWLTSLSYPSTPTSPSGFHCGTCTRCLDLCPTDAFLEPGLLRVDLCLSTQTIENRKAFPQPMIGKMKEQAFGCDICQDVCPWNRKHPFSITQDILPDLNTLLCLPEKDFRDYFRKTPMERPTWAGLRRNFLVLAADRSDVPDQTLIDHLKDQRGLIRMTAQDVLHYRAELRKTPNTSD